MTKLEFEKLFKEHFTYLSNVAYGVVRNEEDSYDIAQQVFTKLWDKREQVDVGGNIKSYLHRATLNTSFNFLEKHKRIVKIDDDKIRDTNLHSIEVNTDYLSGEVDEAIKKAISQLPDKCKMVFALSRFSDKTNKEIAEELNVSIKAVEKHISRALKELRVKLEPYLKFVIYYFLYEVGQKYF